MSPPIPACSRSLKKLLVLNGTQYPSLLSDEYTNAGQYAAIHSIPPQCQHQLAKNLVYHIAMQTDANANFSPAVHRKAPGSSVWAISTRTV